VTLFEFLALLFITLSVFLGCLIASWLEKAHIDEEYEQLMEREG